MYVTGTDGGGTIAIAMITEASIEPDQAHDVVQLQCSLCVMMMTLGVGQWD